MIRTAAKPRRVAHPPTGRPILVFDGACPFCHQWADRLRAAAGDRLAVEPAQSAAPRFPEIAPAEFDRALEFIEIDGRIFSAAEAVLRARALATSRSWSLAAYDHIPGFAPLADAIYRIVARHRMMVSRVMRRFQP